jgi:type III secretion protein O
MAYPLGGLLAIRNFREEAAAKGLRVAETMLKTSLDNEVIKDRDLQSFHQWRLAEVERRYQSIMNQAVNLVELDKFKAGLAALEDQELCKVEDKRLAQKEVENSRKKLEEARAFWLASDRARQKILFHRDEWEGQQAREVAYKEDMEMEEFKPVLFTAAE